MRLAFVLPRFSRTPIGGYRVVYEHARRLAARGHAVTLIHDASLTPPPFRSFAAEAVRRARRPHADPSWFALADVSVRGVFRLRQAHLLGYDRVVATSWASAAAAQRENLQPERACYFIQSYETWSGPSELVDATWRLPWRKVVIARWLEGVAEALGAGPVTLVPNAIDTESFPLLRDPVERTSTVMMLWHVDPVKGSAVGMDALAEVHARRPNADLVVFSTYSRVAHAPEWLRWEHLPTQRRLVELYNDASIFLSPSNVEGWALPPAEAMASGCALVATDIGGVRDYAVHGKTALLAPAGDAHGLAEAVVTLLDDAGGRIALARAGRATIREQFTWERSSAQFERALETPDGSLLR